MSQRCLGCMELFGDEFEICPHCGYIVGTQAEEAIHIEPGTILHDRYIVGKVIGYGGFGITYLAWDAKLEQKVAIKEYLPSEFSTRMPGQSQVTVFNGEKNEQFRDGLLKFVDEARHLAKFQNEQGIVKIFDSFEENDTAYIIMEFLDGETLTSYLKKVKTIPEDEAVKMMMPVMESLQVVHEAGLLHRDIAPDNIFLTKTGEVKLIDFGASRYATTSHSRSLTVIIKPGYSPEEQYRSRGDQGPHTDVYAVAATLYKMITGKTPPDAMERRAKYENQNKDILEEPHKINKNISLNRENAILNAMNVRIEDRTPDIATFVRDINADPPVKRIYGKIKKIDIYSWPLWLKILIPSVLSVVVIFGVLLLTGIIKFSNFTEEITIPENIVTVPDVEGLYKDEALKLVADSQLLATTDGTIESEYIPAGKIILQTPVGGSYMDINGTVLLMLSSGKSVVSPENGVATVPYVIWDTKEDAISKLLQAGLNDPDIIEQNDENIAYGSVIEQSIEAGTEVEEGTKITLTISIGPAAFEMPDVVGQKKDAAESTLTSKGLVVVVQYEKNESVPEGNVINQSISEGTSVKRGDEIIITVSSGRETIEIEDVTGKTRSEAENLLKQQGFKVKVLENYDSNVPVGNVIGQSPNAGTSQLPDSTVVIYVSKGKQPIKVTYDANGGSVSPESKEMYLSDAYGTLPSPVREGYTFEGWYSSKSGGIEVKSNTEITTPSNHSIYARWTANTYTVSFDSNGGGNAPKSKSVTFGKKYGVLDSLSKTGYIFEGWYTAASGGSRVTENTEYAVASNQTLYAHWKVVNYTISFNANGGEGAPASKSISYGAKYGDLGSPKRKGYSFKGWFTAESGGSQITSSDVHSQTSNITFYAHWEVNQYFVSLVEWPNISVTDYQITYGGKYDSVLYNPEAAGYTFLGWYTLENGGTKITADTVYDTDSNQTLYAHWKANSYTLSFNANGGGTAPANKTVTFGSKYGTLETLSRTGYTFDGWYTSANGGTKVTSDTVYSTSSNQTLYAHWKANSYIVSFNTNGGGTAPANKTVTFGSKYGTLETLSRTGYTFDGWYTSANGGTKVTSDTVYSTSSNQTLYAHWKVNSYIISFNTNGGGTAPANKTVTFGSKYGTLEILSRTGYTFDGWYTSANGGTKVTSDTVYSTSSNQTLYAHWKANSYTLSFNANGGSISTTSKSISYGSTYGSLPTPVRDYYTFDGWYTSSSGGSKVSSSTTMGAGNTTIYAHWSLNPVYWALESQVPSGAQKIDEKWTYTRTQTKESTSSSMSGWTQTGSYWQQTGNGSTNYATFPSGFDTSNWYYTNFAKSPYSAYDNGNTKREVSNTWAGFIYWHWMYNCGGASGTSQRGIYDRKGTGYYGFYYQYFYAFNSTNGNYASSNDYCNNLNITNYIIPERSSFADCGGSTRWFRFDFYTSAYTDYQRIYQYKKVTTGIESSTKITAGGEISNVQHYVQYRAK